MMKDKALFTSITLIVVLIGGFLFYENKLSELQSQIDTMTAEHKRQIAAIKSSAEDDIETLIPEHQTDDSASASTLQSLNDQLISARSQLKKTQQELLLVNAKSGVLIDEASRMQDARHQLKTVKKSLATTEQALKTTEQALQSSQQALQSANAKISTLRQTLQAHNKTATANNLGRITTLKGASTGIAVGGLLLPVVGVATLGTYSIQAINNHCQNIKDIITLEEAVFGRVVSLDAVIQDDYQQQCTFILEGKTGLQALESSTQ